MDEVDMGGGNQLAKFLNSGFEDKPPVIKSGALPFRYSPPQLRPGRTRGVVRLATTELLFAAVQIFVEGGEKVRHSHAAMDGFWLVLKGTARFYVEDEEPTDIEPMGGITIPRGVEYWFETVGAEPLEILQVDAIQMGVRNTLHADPATAGEFDATAVAVFDALEAESPPSGTG